MESYFQVLEILDWQFSQTDGFPVQHQPSSISNKIPFSQDLSTSASLSAAGVPAQAGSVLRVEDRRKLRMLFEQDLLDYGHQIEAAIAEDRFDDLRRLVHRLKGSSSMYGYQSILRAALEADYAFCHAKVPLGLKDRLTIVETAHKLSGCCLEGTIE